jgi:hypothetical protein
VPGITSCGCRDVVNFLSFEIKQYPGILLLFLEILHISCAMVVSTGQLLAGGTALFSLLGCILAAVTIYTSVSGVVLSQKSLRPGEYVWLGVLLRADTHRVKLGYDEWKTEVCVWVTAGSSVLAGLFGVARVGMQERERRRRRVVDQWVCFLTIWMCV